MIVQHQQIEYQQIFQTIYQPHRNSNNQVKKNITSIIFCKSTHSQRIIINIIMSRSPRLKHSQSRSPSQRATYINEQASRREKHTSFHSPYKDGRPNRQYINPSFISNSLFYPKEYTKDPQIALVKGLVPSQNDIKKEALYQKRMKTENEQRDREKSAGKPTQPHSNNHNPTRTRQQRNERQTTNTIIRLNQPEILLNTQLETLQNYRQTLQEKQKQREKTPIPQKPSEDLPPYFEKTRRDAQYMQREEARHRAEMGNWMVVTGEIQQLRRQAQKAGRAAEQERTCRLTQQNRAFLLGQEERRRRDASLLGTILREQIRTNQLRREKEWQR